MIYLNVGNLWDEKFLDQVIAWNAEFKDKTRVSSLFGSIPAMTPTARSTDRLPVVGNLFAEEYIQKATDNGISIRYTLNQSCIGQMQQFYTDWESKLRRNISELHEMGIHQWTVTSPLLVELVHGLFPSDFIEVSTIAEVSSHLEAERWMAIGASGVNLSTSINRDLDAIRGVFNTGIEVAILANEACLYKCPWRRECYNLSSHDSLRTEKYFNWYPFNRCNSIRISEPIEWVKSRMILPQWMHQYQEIFGIDNFKVSFRTHPLNVALPILKAYMAQTYSGNLLDLWPTVSNLGHTDEPSKSTFISAEYLGQLNIAKLLTGSWKHCSTRDCDSCFICDSIYRAAVGKAQYLEDFGA